MDVALAPAHGAQPRAEAGARGVEHALAKCEASGGIADEGRIDVALAQRDAERGAQRLLPLAEEDAADDFSSTVEAREFLLKNAGKKHPAEGTQIALTPPVRLRHHARDVTGLQHSARIGNAAERAQWISFHPQPGAGEISVQLPNGTFRARRRRTTPPRMPTAPSSNAAVPGSGTEDSRTRSPPEPPA